MFFQAEDGIRDLVRSRGLGDVYKRQVPLRPLIAAIVPHDLRGVVVVVHVPLGRANVAQLSLIHI